MQLVFLLQISGKWRKMEIFDSNKVYRLAEFYSNDLFSSDLIRFEMQIDNYSGDTSKG